MKNRSYGGTNGSLPSVDFEVSIDNLPGAQVREKSKDFLAGPEHFPALARQLTSSAGRTRVSAQLEGFFVARAR